MVLDSVKFTPAFLYLTGNCMEMCHNGEQATAAMTVARAITERGARKKSFLSLIRVRLNSQKTTTKKGHYTPARILMFSSPTPNAGPVPVGQRSPGQDQLSDRKATLCKHGPDNTCTHNPARVITHRQTYKQPLSTKMEAFVFSCKPY